MSDNEWVPPEIDYLAKDYASFRRLMLDHLSLLVPDWGEQSPADLGHAVVEALAYAADYLSYYQDAVASEAYLGTARLRRSVRRHVRPLEYYLQEGCNARAWVQVQVSDKVFLVRGTQLLTRLAGRETSVIRSDEAAYHQALQDGVTVFETMHHIYLRPDHNQIPILQRDKEDCLPQGSTEAYLKDRWPDPGKPTRALDGLEVGDVLVFEELCDPRTGLTARANPAHRHAVRLTEVTRLVEETGQEPYVKIEWAAADALPFDLCIAPPVAGHPESSPSVAQGNIVLADHGRMIRDEELPVVQPGERYRPRLRFPGLSFAAPYDSHMARTQPAYLAMQYHPYEAFGWVRLREYAAHFAERTKRSPKPRLLQSLDKDTITISGVDLDKDIMMMRYDWTLRRDLLNSGPFDRDFQVEMEEDRWAYLRFGFEGTGKLPDPGDRFVATYRIGNGSQGNVSAETIAHVVEVVEDGKPKRVLKGKIKCVRNPMPARGGRDAEGIQSARLHAPYAYRAQKGCVTEADYARHASQHPAVAQAVAHMRWIGSARTVVIYAQRADGQPVDDDFQQELRDFIEPCRLMGHDLQIRAPRFVPLLISLRLHLEPQAHSLIVRQQLERVFSDRRSTNGEAGFFYPDNFSFGQPVHRSQVIARAMALPGIKRVEVTRFRRADGDGDVLEIPIGPGEIARLGRIDFDFKGGL
jgi:hypothetical protein